MIDDSLIIGVNKYEPFNLEEELQKVDYTAAKLYKPLPITFSYFSYVKQIYGTEGLENVSPPMHYMIMDSIFNPHTYVLNFCHRGASKSTLVEDLIFFIADFSSELDMLHNPRSMLYISDTKDNGVKTMQDNLELKLLNSEFLQSRFPRWNIKDGDYTFWNLEGRRFKVKAFGIEGGARGQRPEERPKLVILDDIISDKVSTSPESLKKIAERVSGAISYGLHPIHKKIVWNGTPFAEGDPFIRAAKSGAYKVNLFPVCEQFPVAKKDYRGSWEDRFNYESLLLDYKKALSDGEISIFNREMMLQIVSEEDLLISSDYLLYYSRHELLQRQWDYNFYITTDFAVTASKVSDCSFISVWAENSNKDLFWVDGWFDRVNLGDALDKLFDFVQEYNPVSVGIETSGQQGGFIPYVQELMLQRNLYFTLAKTEGSNKLGISIPNTMNKLGRMKKVTPLFQAHKIYFPDDYSNLPACAELLNEIKLTTHEEIKSKLDDGLDTVSMLMFFKRYAPSSGMPKGNTSNIWSHGRSADEEPQISRYIP